MKADSANVRNSIAVAITIAVIGVLAASIGIFLTVDFKSLQYEGALTVLLYYLGMAVTSPSMMIGPFLPDALSKQTLDVVVGVVGLFVTCIIGLIIYRKLNPKDQEGDSLQGTEKK